MLKILLLLISFNIQAKYLIPTETVFISNYKKLKTTQKGTYWCWLATIEASLKNYGINKSQESIFKNLSGLQEIYPQLYNEPRMALTPSLELHLVSDFDKIAPFRYQRIQFQNIIENIKQNIPVIANYNYHSVLIVAYKLNENTQFLVMDPRPSGDNFYWVDYKEIKSGSNFLYNNYPSVFFVVSK